MLVFCSMCLSRKKKPQFHVGKGSVDVSVTPPESVYVSEKGGRNTEKGGRNEKRGCKKHSYLHPLFSFLISLPKKEPPFCPPFRKQKKGGAKSKNTEL